MCDTMNIIRYTISISNTWDSELPEYTLIDRQALL